ncbi:uncharacterized protein BJ212DRAFT_678926 [Suillus subaureus]|uniref:Uncharacterized protein n=1 Tax=Suillus subaureus TaxID=48587 RepID=A0A9P7JHQ6_9AGAM|nr:uncharacterized protein BJ212DRAFT_678926 [Suillus subaureus]KAG1823423.1 hypothetical protein BJ212DRAFT_678926 [Suillus subaureus]
MSLPVVASGMPGGLLSASEVSRDKSATVDPMDVNLDSAVVFVSTDNGPLPALNSEAARSQQHDKKPAEVSTTASSIPPEPQPVCSDSTLHSNLSSSLLSTEAPPGKSVEHSHSAKVVSLAPQKELEENIEFSASTQNMEIFDMVNPLASTSTDSSSPSQLPVPLPRETSAYEPSADKIAHEMNLRRLVHESKQNKANARGVTSSSSMFTDPATLPPTPSAVNGDVALAQPSPTVSSATFVLPFLEFY